MMTQHTPTIDSAVQANGSFEGPTEYDLLDIKHPEALADDLAQGRITEEDVHETLTREEADQVVREVVQADPNKAARMMMVSIDPLLRKLPYEQRTATLLNLLVTYAAEQPAALQARGKFINAMTHEFKVRLQKFLPMLLG